MEEQRREAVEGQRLRHRQDGRPATRARRRSTTTRQVHAPRRVRQVPQRQVRHRHVRHHAVRHHAVRHHRARRHASRHDDIGCARSTRSTSATGEAAINKFLDFYELGTGTTLTRSSARASSTELVRQGHGNRAEPAQSTAAPARSSSRPSASPSSTARSPWPRPEPLRRRHRRGRLCRLRVGGTAQRGQQSFGAVARGGQRLRRCDAVSGGAARRLGHGRRGRWACRQLEPRRAVDRLDDGSRVPRGKVIGGSSTVNGGVFLRATAADFDRWAALGNDEWSFAKVLPFLRRLEDDRDFPTGELHGTGGPMPVTRAPRRPTASAQPSVHRGVCRARALPRNPTRTCPASAGFGPLPRNIVDGVRVNAAMAYIAPHRDRPNLTIESEVSARRVVFTGQRATAVEVERSGVVQMFSGDEIVLCAGAGDVSPPPAPVGHRPRGAVAASWESPLSPICAGVGTRCRDHPQLFLGFEPSTPMPPSSATGVVEVALDTVIDDVPVALMPYLTSMAELVPGSGASNVRAGHRCAARAGCRPASSSP